MDIVRLSRLSNRTECLFSPRWKLQPVRNARLCFGAIMIDLSNIACWKVCICVCHTPPRSRLVLKEHCVEVIGSLFFIFLFFYLFLWRTGFKQISFYRFMNESHLNAKESDLFVFCGL